MKVLLTGGTGLVGSRVLQRFGEEGVDCRALIRAGKGIAAGAEVVVGDLLAPETLAAALEGVSAVVHLAAVFRTAEEGAIWKAISKARATSSLRSSWPLRKLASSWQARPWSKAIRPCGQAWRVTF